MYSTNKEDLVNELSEYRDHLYYSFENETRCLQDTTSGF